MLFPHVARMKGLDTPVLKGKHIQTEHPFLPCSALPVLLWMVLTVVADVRGGEDGSRSRGLPPSPSSSPAQPWSMALT